MKLLIILTAGLLVAANGEGEEPKERQFSQHPAVASSINPNDQQQLLQYLVQLSNNPLLQDQDLRFLFNKGSSSASKTTTTVYSTSTSVVSITCTVSTTACASGRRRRRALLSDLTDHQFEEVKPSAVIPVEVTATAVDPINMREGKEADPQHIPHYYKPYETQGSLEPSTSRQTIPSFLSPVVNPALVLNNFLHSALVPQYIANALPMIPVNMAMRQSSSSSVVTVTAVVCTYSFSTIRSTPACSAPGTILQCPASVASG